MLWEVLIVLFKARTLDKPLSLYGDITYPRAAVSLIAKLSQGHAASNHIGGWAPFSPAHICHQGFIARQQYRTSAAAGRS